MRVLWLTILLSFMISVPAFAGDGAKSERGRMLMHLLSAWLDSVGDEITVKAETLEPSIVDGTGNTVINIDEIVFNIDVGDLTYKEENDGGTEIAHQLVDLLRQRGMQRDGPDEARFPRRPLAFPGWGEHRFGGHGMPWPEMPDAPRPGFNPEVAEMFQQVPPNMDPEFMQFMMKVGRLAWTNPDFRVRLEELLREFSPPAE
ncbi:hypothetical protein JW859_12200 [bacterium]|nr:hypothetical protein [bacterium]